MFSKLCQNKKIPEQRPLSLQSSFQNNQTNQVLTTKEPYNLQDFIINQNRLNQMIQSLLSQNINLNLHPPKLRTEHLKKDISQLTISNLQTKKKMKHGDEFREMLDPRDVILQHTFDFTIGCDIQEIQKGGFLMSECYKAIKAKTKQFLVETLANILSVSFKFLSEHKLQEKEVKNYAASNIMLNLQSLFQKTIQAVHCLNMKEDLKVDIQELKTDLIVYLQRTMKNILVNLADYYPQAPITGGTMRMKEVINKVNRVDDEANDLIFSNNIKIAKYLNIQTKKDVYARQYSKIQLEEDGDYTQFIMEVVNTAIRVVQTSSNDYRERVNKEIFNQFLRQLFALSQNDSFKKLVEKATPKQIDSQKSQYKQLQKDEESQVEESRKSISLYFQRILQKRQQELQNIQKEINSLKQNKDQNYDQEEKSSQKATCNRLCSQINAFRQKELDQLKDYATGFKIPNHVKPFTKQQMADKKFTAKHSSVLRIMTKWAEYLKEIFDNAQKHVMMKLYPFKGIYNQLLDPDRILNHKQTLIKQIKIQKEKVETKLKSIKSRMTCLIGEIFYKENESLAENVFRFSNTRKTSSKVNAVLTSLMVEYLSTLIHHLLIAGQISMKFNNGQVRQFIANVNLLVFKVSDLMRAKFKCSESSFITLLKTLYILDENNQMADKFRLVRIKKKLEDPANNIMINFMFMNKVVCELQLSIQESKGKEKNYYMFSHFIYELTRGNFGIISECAIMISELDPMVNSCNKLYYEEKTINSKKSQKNTSLKNSEQKVFYCGNLGCQKLVIKQDSKLIADKERKCIECIFKMENILQKLEKNNIKFENAEVSEELLNEVIVESSQVKDYGELKIVHKKYDCYAKIDSSGKLQLVIVVQSMREMKCFMVQITSGILNHLHQKGQNAIDFSQEVEFINIEKKIKEIKQLKDSLLFKIAQQNIQNILKLLGFKYSNEIQLAQFVSEFLKFRTEKNLIKSIKYKTEIINCDNDKEKFDCFSNIVNAYSCKDKDTKESLINKLRYRNQRQLQFIKIKVVQAKGCNITNIEKGMVSERFINLNSLILTNNKLKKFNQQLKITRMQRLNLSQNQLRNVDGLKNITTINTLNLNSNQLQNVNGLKNITTINTLQLINNQLQNVDGLKNIQSIQTLNLKKNQLQNVDGLKNLKTIDTLKIDKNQLQNVDGLQNIQNITQIYLNNNQLQNLDGLKNIKSIKKVHLYNNQLQNVDGLQNIHTIDTLYLHNNQLQNVNGLKNINTINILNLNNNQLQNVDGLENIKTINTLNINKNQLHNVDGLKNITNIKALYLFNNLLKNIDGLQNIRTIDALDLTSNQLQNVDALKNITKINTLSLDKNQLKNVDGLRSMKTINQIYLNNNKLQNVDELKNIQTIYSLYLFKNQLRNLDGLKNIINIDILYLHDNPDLHIEFLPTSLQSVDFNVAQLQDFNFKSLPKLKKLQCDSRDRKVFCNLGQSVQIVQRK